eukprot:m.125186 g.125186  ORF g.125186 m.125186 type:complete len:426 (+) comp29113_c0_seq2:13-1290(+)
MALTCRAGLSVSRSTRYASVHRYNVSQAKLKSQLAGASIWSKQSPCVNKLHRITCTPFSINLVTPIEIAALALRVKQPYSWGVHRWLSHAPNPKHGEEIKGGETPPVSISITHSDNDSATLTDDKAAQAAPPNYIMKLVPQHLRDYAALARVDKPIGTWLLFAPCTWGIALATPEFATLDLKLLTLFGVGAFVMRGAGCTINDMWDSDIDKGVARTKLRPLASGALTHKQALGFLALQLSAGLAVLLQLNMYSIILGSCSLVMVVTYPLMKRITNWPQAYLGLVFNWGALLGWSAVQGDLDLAVVLPLYFAGWSWTMVYDTVYAHQDRADDLVVGVKSTAVLMADSTKKWLTGFGTVGATSLAVSGLQADQGWVFFAGLATAVAHSSWHLHTVDLKNSASCWNCFNNMKWFGAIVFAGAWGDTLL